MLYLHAFSFSHPGVLLLTQGVDFDKINYLRTNISNRSEAQTFYVEFYLWGYREISGRSDC